MKNNILGCLILVTLFVGCSYAGDWSQRQLRFREVSYDSKAITQYPFLEGQIDESLDQLNIPEQRQAKILISDPFDINSSDKLVLLQIIGRSYCGTRGCLTRAYRIAGKESYEEVPLHIVANMPVYKKKCDQQFFLTFTGGSGISSGFSQWKYAEGKFKFSKKYDSLTEAMVCHSE